VVSQNLIRTYRNASDSQGRASAVDFESGKRCRDGYIAIFILPERRVPRQINCDGSLAALGRETYPVAVRFRSI
jgi:hypothetical protein